MMFLTALLGKAKLYLILAAGIAAVVLATLFKARQAGVRAERAKQIKAMVKNMKIAREEIDAARRRTAEEAAKRILDRRK